jgi:hypothetical protein
LSVFDRSINSTAEKPAFDAISNIRFSPYGYKLAVDNVIIIFSPSRVECRGYKLLLKNYVLLFQNLLLAMEFSTKWLYSKKTK